jgi:2-oxoglutarate ferredoxin oxidoreductase subunit gamma
MAELICAGFGGQGVLTAGMLIISAGVKQGRHVSFCPSYGSEMRGGTANCSVIVSEDEIGSPFVTEPGIIIAMNTPSVEKFEPMLRPGGLLLVNSSIAEEREYRGDARVCRVPAAEVAKAAGNPRGANVVMLGALVKKSRLFDRQLFIDAMEEYFGKRGKSGPGNLICFNGGYVAV